MKFMHRALFFIMTLILPLVFGWWLFIPMSFFFIYIAKTPYEIIIAGAILDHVYYFGESAIARNSLAIFAFCAILAALFLKGRIQWRGVV